MAVMSTRSQQLRSVEKSHQSPCTSFSAMFTLLTKEASSVLNSNGSARSEERRVGKECRSRWSQYQAEDGIRAHCVTGVQTCALPILVEMTSVGCTISLRSGDGGDVNQIATVAQRGEKPPIAVHFIFRDVHAIDEGGLVGVELERFGQIGRASCRERV